MPYWAVKKVLEVLDVLDVLRVLLSLKQRSDKTLKTPSTQLMRRINCLLPSHWRIHLLQLRLHRHHNL